MKRSIAFIIFIFINFIFIVRCYCEDITKEFSVTVPTSMPVYIDKNNNIITSDNIVISNNSYGPVELKEIKFIKNKDFDIKINGLEFNKDNKLNIKEKLVILSNSNITLDYDINIKRENGSINTEIGSLIFVIDWFSVYKGGWDTYAISKKEAFNYGIEYNKINDYDISINNINKNLDSIKIPTSIDGYLVKEIGEHCFYNSKVSNIDISETIASIRDNCFEGCENLKYISIPNNIESIGYNSFKNCINLNTININKYINSIEGSPWGSKNSSILWKNNILKEEDYLEDVNKSLYVENDEDDRNDNNIDDILIYNLN